MRTIPAQTLFNMIGFHTLVLFFPAAILVLWLRPKLWVHALSLFLGMLTGLISLRGDDPQFPVLLLLVFGFFAGFARPRRAWIFALLLAIWVPVTLVAGLFAGVVRGQPFGVPASCIAFVPALVGVYIGVFIHHSSTHPIEPSGETRESASARIDG